MLVTKHINSIFNSNTYLIGHESFDYCWLVDIGDVKPFLNLNVKGIFLTHSHFDHIYGINEFVDKNVDCIIYTSEFGKEALCSEKLNLSKYHESPLKYDRDNIKTLHNQDKIELFPDIFLEVIETPGHCKSCLTYFTDDYIFTGDSYIPGIKVVTNLPRGNKIQAQESVEKIKNIIGTKIICPGHGDISKSTIVS